MCSRALPARERSPSYLSNISTKATCQSRVTALACRMPSPHPKVSAGTRSMHLRPPYLHFQRPAAATPQRKSVTLAFCVPHFRRTVIKQGVDVLQVSPRIPDDNLCLIPPISRFHTQVLYFGTMWPAHTYTRVFLCYHSANESLLAELHPALPYRH